MGTCLSTEVGAHVYEVKGDPPPPPWSPPPPPIGQNMGQAPPPGVQMHGMKPPMSVAVLPLPQDTSIPKKIPKPPSTLAIIPGTPNTQHGTTQEFASPTSNCTTPGAEPGSFHFAFDTLKGETGTDTMAVTPDLLKKPKDFVPKLSLSNKTERNPSSVSRISTVSQQTCDTISIRSDLSRQNSASSHTEHAEHLRQTSAGVSQIEMGVSQQTEFRLPMGKRSALPQMDSVLSQQTDSGSAHNMTARSSSVPSNPSNRTSSTVSSNELRTFSLNSQTPDGVSEVVMRKDYMKSRLTVRQNSQDDTLSKDVLQWKRGNCLGRGSFGTVYLGLTHTGELIAVKQMVITLVSERELKTEYTKIYREVEILKHLRHQNIVTYLGSSFEGHTISIFTQYVSGGSLANLIQQFGALGEGITAKYTKQLLSAISYMHENKVVHRDIKSGNIMMTPEGVLKLIDFGCARKLALRVSMSGSHMMRSWKGTPYWMAPEVIHESGHGKKSDIWSLGCTVYEMLIGIPPWGDREPIAAMYAIGCEDIPMPQLPDVFSIDAREFVNKCLTKDKFRRPCAVQLQLHAFVYPAMERQLSDTCNDDSKWVETL